MLALAVPTAAARSTQDAAEAMTERINSVRADHGLRPLKQAPKLMRSSRRYVKRMMRNDNFSHGSSYRIPGFRVSGEMLAWNRGWKLGVNAPVKMWLNSSGHRALMLSSSFGYVGAAPARGRFGGALTTMWVVHFAAH